MSPNDSLTRSFQLLKVLHEVVYLAYIFCSCVFKEILDVGSSLSTYRGSTVCWLPKYKFICHFIFVSYQMPGQLHSALAHFGGDFRKITIKFCIGSVALPRHDMLSAILNILV